VAAEEVPDRLTGVGYHPLVDFSGAGSQHRHSDRVFVRVEPDVSTLAQGRSLRMSAPRGRSSGTIHVYTGSGRPSHSD